MTKRENDTYRYGQGHPPDCTCVSCINERMLREEVRTRLKRCPYCLNISLSWNGKTKKYECQDINCISRKPLDDSDRLSTTGFQHQRTETKKGLSRNAIAAIVFAFVAAVTIGIWHEEIGEFLSGAQVSSSDSVDQGDTSTISPLDPATSIEVFYGEQPPYIYAPAVVDGSGRQIQVELINNPQAVNPTWSQLEEFLIRDQTDKEGYDLLSYPCSAYAQQVHNNAEAAGISAAWVAIDFADDSVDHALNAFETSDQGLVFIDCGGEDLADKGTTVVLPLGGQVYGETDDWDKLAYVEIGEPCGLISIPNVKNYGFAYAGYQKWQDDVSSFHAKLDLYHEQLGGRTHVSEREHQDLTRKAKQLDALADRIGGFWEPLGLVSHIKIYW